MKLRSISSLGAALAVAGVLAGCGSSVKLDDAPVESRTGSAVGSSGGAGGQAQSQVSTVNLAGQNGQGDAASQLARVVYFDFDSYVVKDEYRPVVSSYVKVMAGGQKRLTIEGHADERGGREYNLALGQKRAEAVRRALSLLGVQDGQMEAVSFGEEKPAMTGLDEAAWSKNRRVEITYR